MSNNKRYDRPCPKSKKRYYEEDDNRRQAAVQTASTSIVPRDQNRVAKRAMCGAVTVHDRLNYPQLPRVAPHAKNPSWKKVPPALSVTVAATAEGGIELKWEMKAGIALQRCAEVKAYELYVCREQSLSPDAFAWRMMDVMRDQPLPESCELVDVPSGVHYLAIRAVDVHDRQAPFTVVHVTI